MSAAAFRAMTERLVAQGRANIVWTPAGGWTDTPEGQREAEKEARRIRIQHNAERSF